MTDSPWYQEGLCFACTRCGHCCGGDAGTVRVSETEITRLARRLELGEGPFREIYTRVLPDAAISLRERADGSCIFYRNGAGCTVYSDRPRQCRSWPFWDEVVETPETWEQAARKCPGMNQGSRHAVRWIERTASSDGTSRDKRRMESDR